MKIVVTGAAGFVGSKLVVELANNGIVKEVIAYDNLSAGSFDYLFNNFAGKSKVKVVLGDILDGRALDRAFSCSDAVIHAASIKMAADPHQFDQVNCWGTAEVVAAFERCGASRLISVGRISVFGSANDSDNLKPNPSTPYEWSLVRGEEHVMRLVKAGKATILRLGEICGVTPSNMMSSGINTLVFKAAIGEKLDVLGNGNQQINITCVESVPEVVGSILAGNIGCSTYNLIDGTLTTLELVDAIKAEYPDLEVIFLSHHYESAGITIPRSAELPVAKDISTTILKIKQALE